MKVTRTDLFYLDSAYGQLLKEESSTVNLRIILLRSSKKLRDEIVLFREATNNPPEDVKKYQKELDAIIQKVGRKNGEYFLIPNSKKEEFKKKEKKLQENLSKEYNAYQLYETEIDKLLKEQIEIELPKISQSELEKLNPKLVKNELLRLLVELDLLD